MRLNRDPGRDDPNKLGWAIEARKPENQKNCCRKQRALAARTLDKMNQGEMGSRPRRRDLARTRRAGGGSDPLTFVVYAGRRKGSRRVLRPREEQQAEGPREEDLPRHALLFGVRSLCGSLRRRHGETAEEAREGGRERERRRNLHPLRRTSREERQRRARKGAGDVRIPPRHQPGDRTRHWLRSFFLDLPTQQCPGNRIARGNHKARRLVPPPARTAPVLRPADEHAKGQCKLPKQTVMQTQSSQRKDLSISPLCSEARRTPLSLWINRHYTRKQAAPQSGDHPELTAGDRTGGGSAQRSNNGRSQREEGGD